MRGACLVALLWSCTGGGPPDGLALPTGVLPDDQPWVLGGPGLALTSAQPASAEPETPLILSDELMAVASGAWEARRPADAPSGVAVRSEARRPTTAPVISVDHAIERQAMVEVAVEVRTTGLELGPRAGGAALVVEELDGQGERVALHDGAQRLSGDTDWRTQTVRVQPRSKGRSLRIRLEPAAGRAMGEAAFRNLSVRVVPAEERLGPRLAGHHARAHEVSLGRITRPALVTRAGEFWTADVSSAGGTLELGFARPRRGRKGEMCLSAVVGTDETTLSCLGAGDAGRWRTASVAIPPGDGAQRVRVAISGPPGAVALLGDPVVRSGREILPGRPDLVLIVLDTLRADHLGMHGYADRPTSPHIDAFAARAVRYDQARSTSGWTATSLGSVVTGLMPSAHRAGTRQERAYQPASVKSSTAQRHRLTFLGLRPDRPTVPELLRREGYRTMSWVDNTFFAAPYGFARGFSEHDRYAGDDLQGLAEGVGKATAFLDGLPPRSARAPYLVVLHAIDPHAPYQARVPAAPGFEVPESIRGEMVHIEAPEQEAWSVEDIWKAGRVDNDALKVPYDSEIRYMDEQLGPLLERLDAAGAGIVLLSDHGEEFYEHQGYSHGRTLYEEVLRVPLVVREPGAVPTRGVVHSPVALDGVAATLLGFAGLSAPPGAAEPLPVRDDPYAEGRAFVAEGAYRGNDLSAVRIGRLKAVLKHPPGLRSANLRTSAKAWSRGEMTGDLAVYDLDMDPSETVDVTSALESGERDELLQALHRHLATAEPGVHIRCEPGSGDIRIRADEPVSRFVPFAWSARHSASIDGTRRSLAIRPAGSDPLWGVLRFTAEPMALALEVDGAAVMADVSEDAELPSPLPGTSCTAWRVRAEGSDASLDAEEVANLEALGYVGD
ncbi:MAG: sulfatase-like hydrolase/transferase [Myxococcota bacterium]|nr:sulfatase-like hydrolase/transferase [Myxococcota bacterium]